MFVLGSRRPAAVLIACALLVLAGCSSGGDATSSGTAAPGYPVTVPGKFGSATLPTRPVRVVALSWTDADLALGLGVVPVGVGKVSTEPTGIEPWTQQRIAALGGAPPAVLDTTTDDPLEAIAALDPDVILATKDYNLGRSYDQLSRIAPVVTYQQAPNVDSWQDSTRRVGQALGASDKAETLVNQTQQAIAGAASAHPGLKGKSYTFVVGPSNSGFYAVNSTQDVSAQFLAALGMRINPTVAGAPPSSIPGRTQLGWEHVSDINADVVLATGSPSGLRTLAGEPGFSAVPAVAAGHYLALTTQQAQAIAFPSPVSLQWAVGSVVPQVGRVVGD